MKTDLLDWDDFIQQVMDAMEDHLVTVRGEV